MKDAKLKAEDYVSVLGKSRQSCNYYRQFTKLSTTAFYARMKTMEMDESAATRNTGCRWNYDNRKCKCEFPIRIK
jgi:hypothetical protein